MTDNTAPRHILEAPEPPPRPEPVLADPKGRWGGGRYTYRGAVIECLPGAHVCSLFMEGHLLDGMTFGVVGTITPLVALWVDERRLPDYMRVVPRSERERDAR